MLSLLYVVSLSPHRREGERERAATATVHMAVQVALPLAREDAGGGSCIVKDGVDERMPSRWNGSTAAGPGVLELREAQPRGPLTNRSLGPPEAIGELDQPAAAMLPVEPRPTPPRTSPPSSRALAAPNHDLGRRACSTGETCS